jgi:hypothetical protein
VSRAKPKRALRPGSTGPDPTHARASGPEGSGGPRFAERSARLLFGAAVLLAQILLSLAVFNPAPHSGGDNAGYISLAHGLLTTGTYTEVFDPAGLPHTKYPPLFPVLLALWMLLGAKTWTALKT